MEFDYISYSWFVFLILCTPLIKSSPYTLILRCMWVYGVIVSQLPVINAILPVKFYLAMENSQNQFLCMVLLFTATCNFKFKPRNLLIALGVANLTVTLIFLPFQHRWMSGLIFNKSMNSILNVMLLPYLAEFTWLAYPVVFLTLLFSSASTAWLSFLFLGLAVLYKERPRYFWRLSPIGVSIFLCFGKLFVKDFFDPTTRFSHYGMFFSYLNNIDVFFGKGPASFFAWSAYIQATNDQFFVKNPVFDIWMHSDVLQYIFEFGSLMVGPLIYTVYKVWPTLEKREFYALSALLAGSIFYYPWHYPVHLFAIFLILKLIADRYKTFECVRGIHIANPLNARGAGCQL